MNIINGLICQPSKLLPIDETIVVCNIESKSEIRILSGRKINYIKLNDGLILSQELFDIYFNNIQKENVVNNFEI